MYVVFKSSGHPIICHDSKDVVNKTEEVQIDAILRMYPTHRIIRPGCAIVYQTSKTSFPAL